MPITLITGLPRNGKSLFTISKYRDAHLKRPVFYANIPGLKLPWKECDPQKWQDLPDGSLIVLDEAQEYFPIRGRDKPPEWIEMIARHGHRGFDFVLITQSPMMIDSFVRQLVQEHFDVCRAFGLSASRIHHWPTGRHDQCRNNSKGSESFLWKYDKSVYSLYTSSAEHNVQIKVPPKVFIFAALPFLIGGCLWYLFHRGDARGASGSGSAAVEAASAASAPALLGPGGQPGAVLTSARAYAEIDFRPRVPGLPHTAPAYDHLTVPVEAPYPAYCVSLGPDYPCKCFTQRNTGLDVPRLTCESIAKNGFFAYWVAQAHRSGGAGSAGPDGASLLAAAPPARSASASVHVARPILEGGS